VSEENMDDKKSDTESSSSSQDIYDDDENYDDEDSNNSSSLQIHNLEASVLKACGHNLDLAAFFLCNLNKILGLHSSRDTSMGKVNRWIPGLKYSPNSSETGSRQTQSSYGYPVSGGSSSQNEKRQRRVNRDDGEREQEKEDDDDDEH